MSILFDAQDHKSRNSLNHNECISGTNLPQHLYNRSSYIAQLSIHWSPHYPYMHPGTSFVVEIQHFWNLGLGTTIWRWQWCPRAFSHLRHNSPPWRTRATSLLSLLLLPMSMFFLPASLILLPASLFLLQVTCCWLAWSSSRRARSFCQWHCSSCQRAWFFRQRAYRDCQSSGPACSSSFGRTGISWYHFMHQTVTSRSTEKINN